MLSWYIDWRLSFNSYLKIDPNARCFVVRSCFFWETVFFWNRLSVRITITFGWTYLVANVSTGFLYICVLKKGMAFCSCKSFILILDLNDRVNLFMNKVLCGKTVLILRRVILYNCCCSWYFLVWDTRMYVNKHLDLMDVWITGLSQKSWIFIIFIYILTMTLCLNVFLILTFMNWWFVIFTWKWSVFSLLTLIREGYVYYLKSTIDCFFLKKESFILEISSFVSHQPKSNVKFSVIYFDFKILQQMCRCVPTEIWLLH